MEDRGAEGITERSASTMWSLRKGKILAWLKCGAAIFAAVLFMAALRAHATSAQQVKQPWHAPASAKAVTNPVASSEAARKEGAELYQKNCVICHGAKGASNGPAAGSLPQKPANFTDVKMMNDATDGELFWKITTGRAPMPSWQDRLSERQRWELVIYLRDLARKGQYKYLGSATKS